MRLRDIINGIKEGAVKVVIEHTGKSRKTRRAEAAEARHVGSGAKRTKPRNWNRDQHKRRVEQKRRRKQRWKK